MLPHTKVNTHDIAPKETSKCDREILVFEKGGTEKLQAGQVKFPGILLIFKRPHRQQNGHKK